MSLSLNQGTHTLPHLYVYAGYKKTWTITLESGSITFTDYSSGDITITCPDAGFTDLKKSTSDISITDASNISVTIAAADTTGLGGNTYVYGGIVNDSNDDYHIGEGLLTVVRGTV